MLGVGLGIGRGGGVGGGEINPFVGGAVEVVAGGVVAVGV